MNKINSEKFWKGIKKARKTRYVCTAILAIIAVVFGIIGFIESKRDLGAPIDLSKDTKLNAGEYVYIDVVDRLFTFVDSDYSSVHFVWDTSFKVHLVDILPGLAKELDKATVDNPIRIMGITKDITDETRDDAIELFNRYKNMDAEPLTINKFDNAVGKIYTYAREKQTNENVLYAFALIFLGFALPFAIAILFIENKIKRVLKKLSPEEAELISSEVENEGTIIYEKVDMFLTENYIISLGKSIDITKYRDVVWVYHTDLRQNGVLSNRYVNIITDKFEDHSVPIIPYGKTRDIHLEIIDIIASKNTNILVGYTDENIEVMKTAKEEYKRNKDIKTDL